MKKLILILPVFMLGACSSNLYMKYTDPAAYEQKMAEEKCHEYLTNRRIKVDGIAGYYEYNTNENGEFSCYAVGEEIIKPYNKPQRYGSHRPDVYLRP